MFPEQVDFYVLEKSDDDSRLGLACRLASKAWEQGSRVYLQVDSSATAKKLDNLLWERPKERFMPHAIAGTPEAPRSPVLIGTGQAPEGWQETLISLTENLPEDAASYRRVADVVLDGDEHRLAGRRRFQAYRNMGANPEMREIK